MANGPASRSASARLAALSASQLGSKSARGGVGRLMRGSMSARLARKFEDPLAPLRDTLWAQCGGSVARLATVFDPCDVGGVTAAEFLAGCRMLEVQVETLTGCRSAQELYEEQLDPHGRGLIDLDCLIPMSRRRGGTSSSSSLERPLYAAPSAGRSPGGPPPSVGGSSSRSFHAPPRSISPQCRQRSNLMPGKSLSSRGFPSACIGSPGRSSTSSHSTRCHSPLSGRGLSSSFPSSARTSAFSARSEKSTARSESGGPVPCLLPQEELGLLRAQRETLLVEMAEEEDEHLAEAERLQEASRKKVESVTLQTKRSIQDSEDSQHAAWREAAAKAELDCAEAKEKLQRATELLAHSEEQWYAAENVFAEAQESCAAARRSEKGALAEVEDVQRREASLRGQLREAQLRRNVLQREVTAEERQADSARLAEEAESERLAEQSRRASQQHAEITFAHDHLMTVRTKSLQSAQSLVEELERQDVQLAERSETAQQKHKVEQEAMLEEMATAADELGRLREEYSSAEKQEQTKFATLRRSLRVQKVRLHRRGKEIDALAASSDEQQALASELAAARLEARRLQAGLVGSLEAQGRSKDYYQRKEVASEDLRRNAGLLEEEAEAMKRSNAELLDAVRDASTRLEEVTARGRTAEQERAAEAEEDEGLLSEHRETITVVDAAISDERRRVRRCGARLAAEQARRRHTTAEMLADYRARAALQEKLAAERMEMIHDQENEMMERIREATKQKESEAKAERLRLHRRLDAAEMALAEAGSILKCSPIPEASDESDADFSGELCLADIRSIISSEGFGFAAPASRSSDILSPSDSDAVPAAAACPKAWLPEVQAEGSGESQSAASS
eukprot:TRINITY_DN36346_c0_g1_i1.p1 TRINITY_DN36346_c0_g1~~TRINITY_DN36346_c0_g1_i1.p1  ORF type:complete len:856 (-),score=259.04 TRINITY_DN36346_c0_g1_i1:97-2664(-)